MEFEDKFIAYVDILGFSGFVADAEQGVGRSLDDLLDLLSTFGSPAQREVFANEGPTIGVNGGYRRRDLDFRFTQISDCAILSSELSPAGLINLVHHVWEMFIRFLMRSTLCRGYITRGMIHHTDHQFIGTGYQHACDRERRGTPFVEIDETVVAYVRTCDATVQKTFLRYVVSDGGLAALRPFQRIEHNFVISGFEKLDVDRERGENDGVRQLIDRLKTLAEAYVDRSKPGAVQKAEQYFAALNAQLELCNKTDEFLRRFST